MLIRCPLTNSEIDIGECVVTVDVCDGAVREQVLNPVILRQDGWREICRNCKYHEK